MIPRKEMTNSDWPKLWHLNSLPPYIIQFFMFTNLTCVTGPSANMILKIKPNFDEKNILY
jgi:hypothetical protein